MLADCSKQTNTEYTYKGRAHRLNARSLRQVLIMWIGGHSWLNLGLCALTMHDSKYDRPVHRKGNDSVLPYMTEIYESFLLLPFDKNHFLLCLTQ